jgi:hypothetical protein
MSLTGFGKLVRIDRVGQELLAFSFKIGERGDFAKYSGARSL